MSFSTWPSIAARDLVRRVRLAVGNDKSTANIPLHEPHLDESTELRLIRTIRSGFVSSAGPAVDEFESEISKFTGVSKVVSTSSGTAALQLALQVHGVERGTLVMVPALSFVATANAVSCLGANPFFVDSINDTDQKTFGMSSSSILQALEQFEMTESGPLHRKTRQKLAAIVPMHALGRITNLVAIREIAEAWRVPVVEDAAEAFGSFLVEPSVHAGSQSTAIVSFNGNKTITTGGGGAILTNCDLIADRARHIASTAKIPHHWKFQHDEVGWNFRMPALNAALGLSQLENISSILAAKKTLYQRYIEVFEDSEFFEFEVNPRNQEPNNWLMAVSLREPKKIEIDSVVEKTNSHGVNVRPFWDLLSEQLPYRKSLATSLTAARKLRNSIICLPSSATHMLRP